MRDDLALDGSDIKERPEDGCYIWGLWLEGAGWSFETGSESSPVKVEYRNVTATTEALMAAGIRHIFIVVS